MTDYTIRAITSTAGSAASCAVSIHGTVADRPAITRARPRTAPGVILIEAMTEALTILERSLRADDFVTIEFAGVKSTEIDSDSQLAFRRLLGRLREAGADFAIVEMEKAPSEMAALRDRASFAAMMGHTGMTK